MNNKKPMPMGSDKSASAILSALSRHGIDARRAAEIGVWRGELSNLLLEALPKLTLWMVDGWVAPRADSPWARTGDELAALDQTAFDEARRAAEEVARAWPERAMIRAMRSPWKATDLPDGYFDFVFIDASHAYEDVLVDLRAWHRKVHPGGLLCGHDWGKDPRYGVKEAVTDFLAENGYVDGPRAPVVHLDPAGSPCWFFQVPSPRPETWVQR